MTALAPVFHRPLGGGLRLLSNTCCTTFPHSTLLHPYSSSSSPRRRRCALRRRKTRPFISFSSSAQANGDTEVRVLGDEQQEEDEDLKYVRQVQKVLDLLKKNRDMLFSEVKLTVMIEDPRDAERKRMMGMDDPNDVTREDLVAALEDVHDGRIPENRVALRILAEEMIQWPNLEVEAPKRKPSKSLYAKTTDTGIDPKLAAKRLSMDWDSAAEFEDDEESDEAEVPPAVGYGLLYLVTGFPLIIGVAVVLILFYNSLE